MISITKLSLIDRLKLEAINRIQRGVLFQLFTISILAYYFSLDKNITPYFNFFLILNVISISLRGFLFFIFSKNVKVLLKIYHFQMITAIFSAFMYGIVTYDVIMHFRLFNAQVIVMIYVVNGMMTAVMSSLAPTPLYQRLYFLFISGPALLAFFNPEMDPLFRNVGILFTVYISYIVFSSRGISADLKNSYLSEMRAVEQTETLQQVINLVPGFVALSDSSGQWVTQSESFENLKHNQNLNEVFSQFMKSKMFKLTREMAWKENNTDIAFIVSMQKYVGNSMIVVGVPAEELLEIRKELDSQRLKAEFSARLATLGEMAGGIAHEVNNPLAVIIGNCSQILRLAQDPVTHREKIIDKIEKISKTSFRIGKIISGLKSFSRQSDQDPFEYTMMSQLIEDSLELCREKFYQHSIDLIIDTVPDVTVPIRAVQITQVLINLLNNSFDAVQNLETKKVKVYFKATTTHMNIYVEDSGSGIAENLNEKIFDPFFTTKEVGQGTGLGLSISRSILLDHQGSLTLLKGNPHTTFEVSLPLHRTETTPQKSDLI